MKVRLAIAVALLQVCVLAFMAGQREWISRFGEQLTLRTAPIDPDDPMRGAYVRLDYDINSVPVALCKDGVAEWTKETDYRKLDSIRDRVVYASLRVDESGSANLVSLSDRRPASGPVLRGRVGSVSVNGVQVRYGIEALFMNKDAARATEDAVLRERAGAPMNVHVAVSGSGIGVLKGFDWGPLGITLEFDRPPNATPRAPGVPPPGLAALTVVLHNYGDRDLAIVDLQGGHSFRLLANNRWNPTHYAWVGQGRLLKLPAPSAAEIVVLKPGEVHKTRIDLTAQDWWIVDTNKPDVAPFPMRDVTDGWAASFRIEYAPPGPDMIHGLQNAGLVRHTSLQSRAFNANRGVD